MGTLPDESRLRWFPHLPSAALLIATHGFGMSTCLQEPPPQLGNVRLQWTDNNWATLPFSRGVNHVLIEGTGPGGEVLTFFVDTGASLSVVTPQFLAAVKTDALSPSVVAQAQGASGDIPGSPWLARIRNLHIGDLLIEEMPAVVVDLEALAHEFHRQIHGIIGFNLLSRVITLIDYRQSTISFFRPGTEILLSKLGPPDASVHFDLLMGALIRVVGQVDDDRPADFIVDIGSRYTALNRTAAETSGITFKPLVEQPTTLGLGASAGATVESGKARSLRFGDLLITDPQVYSLPLPVFTTLGLANSAAGLLGNDLLQHYRLAIDYTARELRFWHSAE